MKLSRRKRNLAYTLQSPERPINSGCCAALPDLPDRLSLPDFGYFPCLLWPANMFNGRRKEPTDNTRAENTLLSSNNRIITSSAVITTAKANSNTVPMQPNYIPIDENHTPNNSHSHVHLHYHHSHHHNANNNRNNNAIKYNNKRKRDNRSSSFNLGKYCLPVP